MSICLRIERRLGYGISRELLTLRISMFSLPPTIFSYPFTLNFNPHLLSCNLILHHFNIYVGLGSIFSNAFILLSEVNI